MLDAPVSARVGAEFTGLARVFRSTVMAVDRECDAVLNKIARPLRERLRRKPTLRPEHAIEANRAWGKLMPNEYRLGERRFFPARTEFIIAETRLSGSWIYNDEWNSGVREIGISVCDLVLSVRRGKLCWEWKPRVCISLHALARRIERGAERDHAALVRDLAVLVESDAGSERVGTQGGFWLGAVIEAMNDQKRRGCTIRNVRTWLAT
jgi:hypothetical protein